MVRSMPQKKSLKQIERQQRRKDKEEAKSGGRVEKTIGALDIPEMSSEELMEQLRRMKAVTPTGLATQMNIKVSTAKKLLEELREQRVLALASRSHNLKVYSLNQ
jgi:small subunit ribosomal protein S25e